MRSGIVTGLGTEKDPYVVTANYYYYGLNDEQVVGLQDAISSYNNKGKAHEFKDQQGNKIFVIMNLCASEAVDEDDAESQASSDVTDVGESYARYGNIVSVGESGEKKEFGKADSYRITLCQKDIDNQLNNQPGGNLEKMLRGIFIHEIGHNLGASHGDPGYIISQIEPTPPNDVNTGDNNYRYSYPSVSSNGIRAFMGRVNQNGSIHSYYLSKNENKAVKENKDHGAPGVLKKI